MKGIQSHNQRVRNQTVRNDKIIDFHARTVETPKLIGSKLDEFA